MSVFDMSSKRFMQVNKKFLMLESIVSHRGGR